MSVIEAPSVTTREVYLRAADLIEERGWCQGKFGTDDRLCILGAIFAAEREWHRSIGLDALRMVIGRDVIVPWNDQEGRTQEEVVSALREAAAHV